MRDERKEREHIKAEVHDSWFSLAIGQISFKPTFCFARTPIRERIGNKFPDACGPAIDQATHRKVSREDFWLATRQGCLGHDGEGSITNRHRLLDHSVWALMMLYIGWFFLDLLLPAWRSAPPSRHMELLVMTLLPAGFAIRFHVTLFIAQQVAKRAVLATTNRTSHAGGIWH